MGKIQFYITLIVILIISSSAKEGDKCDVILLKNELIKELKPDFKYDSSNINQFVLESQIQGTEVMVPLFSSGKYKLLFNTAGMSTDFEIKVYNKKFGAKNRKLLYSVVGDDSNKDQNIFVYEPEKVRMMYIDYILPGVKEEGLTSCMLFVIGYQ